jgi:hypothetical protein
MSKQVVKPKLVSFTKDLLEGAVKSRGRMLRVAKKTQEAVTVSEKVASKLKRPGKDPRRTPLELAEGKLANEEGKKARRLNFLLGVTPDLRAVTVRLPYRGVTFTIARATLTFPKSGRNLVGEGLSRRSFSDKNDPDRAFNRSVSRALESLDKKLRRVRGCVGDRFEG